MYLIYHEKSYFSFLELIEKEHFDLCPRLSQHRSSAVVTAAPVVGRRENGQHRAPASVAKALLVTLVCAYQQLQRVFGQKLAHHRRPPVPGDAAPLVGAELDAPLPVEAFVHRVGPQEIHGEREHVLMVDWFLELRYLFDCLQIRPDTTVTTQVVTVHDSG